MEVFVFTELSFSDQNLFLSVNQKWA